MLCSSFLYGRTKKLKQSPPVLSFNLPDTLVTPVWYATPFENHCLKLLFYYYYDVVVVIIFSYLVLFSQSNENSLKRAFAYLGEGRVCPCFYDGVRAAMPAGPARAPQGSCQPFPIAPILTGSSSAGPSLDASRRDHVLSALKEPGSLPPS